MPYCKSDLRGRFLLQHTFNTEIENFAAEHLTMTNTATGELSIQIEIIDMRGVIILIDNIVLKEGESTHQIKVNHLPTGTYFIRFSNPFNKIISRQFIKM